MKLIINPIYTLKPDKGRSLIVQSYSPRDYLYERATANTYVIHPIYAMILSFIDGRSIEECIAEAAEKINVPEKSIQKLIEGWYNNSEGIKIKSKYDSSCFPPHLLVENSKHTPKKYDYKDFMYDELDVVMKRHHTPSSLTLMVNNTCITKCVYCYQDKRKIVGCSIPFDRLKQIIKEAALLNVVNFDIIGGEFILYPYWKELLRELRLYGFQPYLSTKIPLNEMDIKFLSDIGIMDIQISIDSLIPSHLVTSLNVKEDYSKKMISSLDLLEKYGIPILVHSVLTTHNDSLEDMKSVYEELCKHKNVIEWKVVKGEETLYPQVKYSEIEISNSNLNKINLYLS
ncbi:MAG: radical SAM protein, partial [Muribaculaceae bacterium]|nr:radical SAM protein [Muribaculaceae bacterium]